MTILSFRKRQDPPAAATDMFNEARIRVLGRVWVDTWAAGSKADASAAWDDYVAAKARRSASRVEQIEKARGLR